VAPVLAPTHPAVTFTVNERPAVWFAVLSVVLPGAVTTMPLVGVANVTTIVFEPVSRGDGFTTIVALVPGPVAVLQVTDTGPVAVSTLACRLPAQAVSANSPASTCLRRRLRVTKSIRTFLSLGCFLAEIADNTAVAEAAGLRPLQSYRREGEFFDEFR